MRFEALLAAILLLAAIPIPTATALQSTALFAPTGDIQPANSFAVNGCTYAARHTCVDEIPPGPNDGDTTRLQSNVTQDESQIDLTAYWQLDQEDSVVGMRIHFFVKTLTGSWPIGTTLTIFIQENIGGGRICYFETFSPPTSTGSYRRFSYPAGYDETCINSDVNTWEILVVLDCDTPPNCSNWLRITSIYLEILYFDRFGFPSSPENFAWIIYAILIGSGCLIAAWRIKKWRETI